jgi:hypothetical protein
LSTEDSGHRSAAELALCLLQTFPYTGSREILPDFQTIHFAVIDRLNLITAGAQISIIKGFDARNIET